MKGASPPAATDDATAGARRTSLRLGVRKEKRSLMVGGGDGAGGMSWVEVVGEGSVNCESRCLMSIEDNDESESRREVRMDGSVSRSIGGSWLLIAVVDDEEQLVLCRDSWVWSKEEEKVAWTVANVSFLLPRWDALRYCSLALSLCVATCRNNKPFTYVIFISGTKPLHNNRQTTHRGNAPFVGHKASLSPACIHIHV
jgi:hypothetical protein